MIDPWSGLTEVNLDVTLTLGFPWDGTYPCPFVPGQKKILVPVSLCPGTRAGANVPGQNPLSRDVPRDKMAKKWPKKIFLDFLTGFDLVLSRDVPGQKSLPRDFCTCPCPGTKGQRDRETFLSRDKGTTGRPVPVCPGTSRGTSRPLETLV